MSDGTGRNFLLKHMSMKEYDSFVRMLKAIERMNEKQIEEIFNLLPHEAGDVKDVLRKSNV